MRRSFALFLPALVFLASGLGAGEDRKERPGAEKPGAGELPRPKKAAPLFDVDAFIKEHDRNKDGYLSKDELPERYRHNFDKLDANKDGKLSRAELLKGSAFLQPRRRPSDVVFVLVEMSDCDECCAEELQIIYDFLRALDKNKDGKVDATELVAAREDLIKKRVDGIFTDLDKNKDGKISRDEARGPIKRHFAELDTNKDGFISRAELTEAIAAKSRALKKDKAPATDTPTERRRDR